LEGDAAVLCQEAEFCDTAPMLATAFTELVGCQVPIQQAAMGGASTPQLAIAVSRAGGLGMLEHASLIPLADRVAAVEQAHAGPFGVNFLMPFLDRSKLDDVELAAGRARLVEFFYDTPDPGLISLVHAGGALAGWQVGSVAEAMQAVDAGCDLIIAQGVEAGGHVRGGRANTAAGRRAGGGHRPGARSWWHQHRPGDGRCTGRRSGRGPSWDAVCGYRRVWCPPTLPLLAAPAEATILVEAFSVGWPGAPHRVLSSAVAAAEAHPDEMVAMLETESGSQPIPLWFVATPNREVTGHVEAMALYAGQGVGQVTQVVPAAQVVTELADGADRLLRRWGAGPSGR
jgi:nitronate monooxygenase